MQAGRQMQNMQGMDMSGMMQNMQSMMANMNEAQKGYMQAMMKMHGPMMALHDQGLRRHLRDDRPPPGCDRHG